MLESPTLGQVLVLAAVGYGGYLIGRASAGGGSSASREIDSLEMDQALNSLSPDKQAEIDGLLANRKKIAAIKILRAETGLGLRDAKLTIDKRAAQQGIR